MAGPLLRHLAWAALRVARTDRLRPERRADERSRRVAETIADARKRSPYYRALYRGVPEGASDLTRLPLVTKPTLMDEFDGWLTDAEVTRERCDVFLRDPALVGRQLQGKYFVCTTSGVTGHRGVLVHDRRALAVYAALAAVRGARMLSPAGSTARAALAGGRVGVVVAGGHHYAGYALEEMARRVGKRAGSLVRAFDVRAPLPELARGLDAWRPAVLIGYPTALSALATEAEAGRLRIHPRLVITGGEWLPLAERARIGRALGASVRDVYATSEFPVAAFECERGWLHVNEDWCVLEPVEADGSPTRPGRASHTTLLTNLANRVQPLVRYDIGDSITARDGPPCACGSPNLAIRVEGRTDEALRFGDVAILPLALASIVEETPGVRSFQAEQTGPLDLHVRLEPDVDADEDDLWDRVHGNIDAFLARQGAHGARVERDPERPHRDARTGKLREVYASWRP